MCSSDLEERRIWGLIIEIGPIFLQSITIADNDIVRENATHDEIHTGKIVSVLFELLGIIFNVIGVTHVTSNNASNVDKKRSRATSRVYKDAVFDTNEYPGHRRAEAGNIKKSRAFAVPPVIPAEL